MRLSTVPGTSSEDDGSARGVHPLPATPGGSEASLVDPYLPFSTRQVLKIFAEEVPLFFSPNMLQLRPVRYESGFG
jgi:hypothetical protein